MSVANFGGQTECHKTFLFQKIFFNKNEIYVILLRFKPIHKGLGMFGVTKINTFGKKKINKKMLKDKLYCGGKHSSVKTSSFCRHK